MDEMSLLADFFQQIENHNARRVRSEPWYAALDNCLQMCVRLGFLCALVFRRRRRRRRRSVCGGLHRDGEI